MKPIERYSELLRDGPESVELQLKVETRGGRHDTEHLGREAHIAEVTAYCKDKHAIHCSSSSEDMYTSLDDLTDMLSRNLRKHKERKIGVEQSRRRSSKDEINDLAMEADEDDEAFD